MRSSMTRRWVSTCWEQTHDNSLCGTERIMLLLGGACGAHLGSDLRSLLGIHHADVLKVFECVLPVLLLSAHILLQQAEDVMGLRKQRGADDFRLDQG